MKKKHHGKMHKMHATEISKAHGHVPDIAPKGNKEFDTKIHGDGVAHDGMAHHTHHEANMHHGMDQGMGPTMEHGTIDMKHSHLGNNEMHEDDYSSGSGSGEMEEGADHSTGNEHDD